MVARWVVTRIGGDKYPKPGESKIDTTGAGGDSALPAVVGVWVVGARGGGGSWWGRSFLWVRGVVLGAWCFPLGGGVGLVVTISLGSVRVVVWGFGWWCGGWVVVWWCGWWCGGLGLGGCLWWGLG